MDEPTSGLDARAAAVVMRTVRNTVDTGRTVVCTIHQPSIDIFEAFDEVQITISIPLDAFHAVVPFNQCSSCAEDIFFLLQLLLMKRGGQVIYAGPLGRHSHKLIEYFEVSPFAFLISVVWRPSMRVHNSTKHHVEYLMTFFKYFLAEFEAGISFNFKAHLVCMRN